MHYSLESKYLLTNRTNQLHNIYRKMKVDQCSVNSHFVKFVMVRILVDGMHGDVCEREA